MPRHSRKWYEAVKRANAKRRGTKASASTRRKLSKARKKMWRNPKYRARTLKSRRLALLRPEVQVRKRQALLLSWQGKRGEQRRRDASERQRKHMLSLPADEKKRLALVRAKAAAKVLPNLWRNPEWRLHELARRAKVNVELKAKGYRRGSEAVKTLWQNPQWRAKVMRTRRHMMYSNPAWKQKAAKSGALAVRKKFDGKSWNAGHTKATHTGLQKISDSLTGKVPTYNFGKWVYHNHPTHVVMKSSYELLFARWCDERKIEWKYEPRWFNIGKGDWHGVSYTPDFYLPKLGVYVEVKGFFSEENQRKMQAFYKQFPEVQLFLLRYKALQAMRILREHIPHRKPIFGHVRTHAHKAFV